MIFETEILGEPIGEGRPRAVRTGQRVRVHAAPKSSTWRAVAAQQMATEWGGKPPSNALCMVLIDAYMPRPKSRPKDISKEAWSSHVSVCRRQKPDVDNIAKAVLDAIVQAGIIEDDAQVVNLQVMRNMCSMAPKARPCVLVRIKEL